MAQPAPRATKKASKTKSARNSTKAKPANATPVQRQAAERRPFLRFFHPAELRKRTLAVLDRLEGARDPTLHADALAEVVVDLTRCGLDTYFMQSLKRARAGFIVEQSAGLGLAGAVKVLAAVIRSVISTMGAPQLLSVCTSVRAFMR